MSHNAYFKHKQYKLILKIPVFHKNPQLKKPISKKFYFPFPYCFFVKNRTIIINFTKNQFYQKLHSLQKIEQKPNKKRITSVYQ